MALLALHEVTLRFAGPPLLDRASLSIGSGERLGLLGRNGAGKSTLLNVLQGSLLPDSGEVIRQPGLRVASLQQDVPGDLSGSVSAYLHEACGVNSSESSWEIERHIDQAARDLRLDLDAEIATLSAGSKRRVLPAGETPYSYLPADAVGALAQYGGEGTVRFTGSTHDERLISLHRARSSP